MIFIVNLYRMGACDRYPLSLSVVVYIRPIYKPMPLIPKISFQNRLRKKSKLEVTNPGSPGKLPLK